MPADTAKLFSIGRSQAVRLPKQFRFSGTEVFIRRKPSTGEVVLSPKLSTWQDFFELVDRSKLSADFMSDRQGALAEERNLF
ncbi:MAG: type II toxin-antitoxin system VapB family antitoxin [Candidatus Symbiodolus clandestinus]